MSRRKEQNGEFSEEVNIQLLDIYDQLQHLDVNHSSFERVPPVKVDKQASLPPKPTSKLKPLQLNYEKKEETLMASKSMDPRKQTHEIKTKEGMNKENRDSEGNDALKYEQSIDSDKQLKLKKKFFKQKSKKFQRHYVNSTTDRLQKANEAQYNPSAMRHPLGTIRTSQLPFTYPTSYPISYYYGPNLVSQWQTFGYSLRAPATSQNSVSSERKHYTVGHQCLHIQLQSKAQAHDAFHYHKPKASKSKADIIEREGKKGDTKRN